MPQVNLWAVLAAVTSAFVAGGIWYAPALFGKAWQRAGRLSDEDLRGRNLPRVFGIAWLLSLLAAFVFALFLGISSNASRSSCCSSTAVITPSSSPSTARCLASCPEGLP